jgi:D-alanyl-D-alanine carboxypeptidase/D-alanyl-D-alanine-endopeptidase (penicillin-binding protein 4)
VVVALMLSAAAAMPLHRAIDDALDDPALAGSTLAVDLRDAATGATVAARDADRRALPASTVKWLTAVAAAEHLDLDATLPTVLRATGSLREGVLDGDLIVVGGGDPTLTTEQIGAWAESLAGQGLQRVTGAVVGDASVFADARLGAGWAWDDVPYRFSAPVTGLIVDENVATIAVSGGRSGLTVDAGVHAPCVDVERVGGAGAPALRREPWLARWQLTGSLPVGERHTIRTPLADPPSCVAALLTAALTRAGVAVDGPPRAGVAPAQTTLVYTHEGPALRDVLHRMLKTSQNLYAESVLRHLDPGAGPATPAAGRDVVVATIAGAGVDVGAVRLVDGSGLSRYDAVTAAALADVTAWAWSQPWTDALVAMLPVGGVDGTLASRLRGTPAEGRVRAKTGSMTGVRNLVGYAEDADGRPLVVALVMDDFTAPQATAIAAQDRVLALIALSRRGRVRHRDVRTLGD